MTSHSHTHYRSIFISDTHFGFYGSKTSELLSFLKGVECDRLYLIGDIFDLMAMSRGHIHWNDDTTAVIRRIMKMMKTAEVVYLPGNHDEQIRHYVPLVLGDKLQIVDEYHHITTNGQRLLLIHGDKFDFAVGNMKWITALGAHLYEYLLRMNGLVHRIRKSLGFRRYWSLASYLKFKAKQAISFIADFEQAALLYARSSDCVGVVCGHIHTPKIDSQGYMLYINCGDWVESMSAVVEHDTGELELIRWNHVE